VTLTSTVAPDSDSESDTSYLSRTLAAIAGDQLSVWLASFDSMARAEPVARRSYWHHNGFAKLVLEVTAAHRIRLHVWPAGENRLGEWNPHGHRWNFASTVVAGDGLSSTEYVESDTGRHHVLYHYVGGSGGFLTPVGNARLAEHDTRIVRNGERYVLDTSVVHTVVPLGNSLVATLVVQGPARLDHAPVYCPPGIPVDGPIRDLGPAEVRDLVRDVLAARGELVGERR
jgi:hypothetical protein